MDRDTVSQSGAPVRDQSEIYRRLVGIALFRSYVFDFTDFLYHPFGGEVLISVSGRPMTH